MVDTLGSGSSDRKVVRVRVPPSAPIHEMIHKFLPIRPHKDTKREPPVRAVYDDAEHGPDHRSGRILSPAAGPSILIDGQEMRLSPSH